MCLTQKRRVLLILLQQEVKQDWGLHLKRGLMWELPLQEGVLEFGKMGILQQVNLNLKVQEVFLEKQMNCPTMKAKIIFKSWGETKRCIFRLQAKRNCLTSWLGTLEMER